MVDATDQKILTIIQNEGRVTNAEVAKRVGMAPSAVLERLRKLEASGIIQGYTARLNAVALRYGLLAFVFVKSNDRPGEVRAAKLLADIPEVQEVHHIAGEDCFLVKVRAHDTNELAVILREKIGKIKSIGSTRTTIVLETVKETSTLPLDLVHQEGKKP
jgi:Lrp/AsnC family leucine-responsive transcriptional regulator